MLKIKNFKSKNKFLNSHNNYLFNNKYYQMNFQLECTIHYLT